MSVCEVRPRPFAAPAGSRFRILAVDGGGIRGLIAAKVLARLEELLRAREGSPALVDCFDLIAGTSTGGLISLALTAPGHGGRPPLSAARLVEIYGGEEARAVFERPLLRRLPLVGDLIDLLWPKYSLAPLRRELERQLGTARLGDARAEVLVTAYDMTRREPRLFRRSAPESSATSMVDAGLATAAAPTYFPGHRLGGASLVDGGVFAANPTVAAVVEALEPWGERAPLEPADLLVVSLGTGHHELGYDPGDVARWGALDWILPRGKKPLSGEPPLISVMLDGQSDAAHHWAHSLLNPPQRGPSRATEELGAGPRYYRYQLALREPLPLDDAGEANVERLDRCAELLIGEREEELGALAEVLAAPRSDADNAAGPAR